MSRFAILIPLLPLFSASLSLGAVNYVSQERYVAARSSMLTPWATRPDEESHASGFAPFDAAVSGIQAQQTSVLTATGLFATGGVIGSGGSEPLGMHWTPEGEIAWYVPGTAGVDAYSVFDVTFTLDEATDFTLNTQWVLPPLLWLTSIDAKAFISFTGPDTHIVRDFRIQDPNPFDPTEYQDTINEIGTLQAGEYRLIANFSWINSYPGGVMVYPLNYDVSLAFSVPAPSSAAFILIGLVPCARRRRRQE